MPRNNRDRRRRTTPSSQESDAESTASSVPASVASSNRHSSPTVRQRNRLLTDIIDKRLKELSLSKKKTKESMFKYTSNKC